MNSEIEPTHWKESTALSASYTLVMTPANISPFLTMAIMASLLLSEDQTGLVLSIELTVVAFTSAFLSKFALLVALRKILITGLVILIAGNMMSVMAESLDSLISYRVIAGFGAGLLLLGVNIGVAATPDPVRAFGFANTAGLIAAVILSLILPSLIDLYGLTGAYGALVVLALLCLPLIFLYKPVIQTVKTDAILTPLDIKTSKIIMLIVALLLTPAIYLSFYVFLGPIGTSTGLSMQFIGILLAIGQIEGVAAAAFASWLGSRFGILKPMMIALIVQTLAIVIATNTTIDWLFSTCFLVLNALFLFAMPYQLGIGAALDNTGRLAAIAAGAFYFGAAIGPILGGYLISQFGSSSIGIVACVGMVIALSCFWIVVPTDDNTQQSA